MLRGYITTLPLTVVAIAAAGAYLWGWSLWFSVLAVLLYILVKAYGSIFINSNFYIKTICKGDRDSQFIALTFDDGPAEGNTDQILKILKEKNVKATFFCIGRNVEKSKGLLQQIDNDGHFIGNHTFNHGRFFDLLSINKMIIELNETDRAIVNAIGKKPKWFRPPYGVTNPNLAAAVKNGDYKTIGWSVRSFDTISKSKEHLWNRVTKNLKGGDIVLFHDYCDITIELLPEFIDHVSRQGLAIVPLDQLLKAKAYA